MQLFSKNSLVRFVFVSKLIVAFSFFALSYASANTSSTLSEADQAKAIFSLRSTLPEVFSAGSMWYVDPLKVILNGHEFQEALLKPENMAVLKAETLRTDANKKIEVVIQANEDQPVLKISPAGQAGLMRDFASLDGRYQTMEQINKEIVSLIQSLKGQSSQGLLTGMIQSLPPDLKAAAFKLAPEEKAAFVFRHITNEQLIRGFRSTVYTAEQISVHFLINEVQRLRQVETEISTLALFQEWTRKGANPHAMDLLPELKPMQNETGLSALQSTLEGKELKRVKETVQSLVQTQLKPLLVQSNQKAWVNRDSFTIQLLSPQFAMFRGSLNGDCFTTYAYGFAYAPAERTFIVRDADGKFVMTVYSTEVLVDGQRSLYIHEMGSASASASRGADVFRAFFAAKEQLGFSQVVLGQKGMHHGAFKTAAEQVAQPSPTVAIVYLDGKSRELIGNILVEKTKQSYSKSHDVPEAHRNGRLFIPKEDLTDRISVRVSPEATESRPLQMSMNDRRKMILEFIARSQDSIAKVILGTEGHPADAIPRLKSALGNETRLPLQQYYENVKTTSIAVGLGWDEGLMKGNQLIFSRGHILAPDAWQGVESPVSKVTAEYVALILRQAPGDTQAVAVFQKHPELGKTPPLEKLLKSQLKDNYENLMKARQWVHLYKGELSPSVVDALYQVFDFQYYEYTSGFVTTILGQSPHKPTVDQIALVVKRLAQTRDRRPILNMITSRPEMWQPALMNALEGYSQDPLVGTAVQTILELYKARKESHGHEAVSCRMLYAG